ncbi:MAG: hypothetical protein P8N49_07990 [Opitutales bacterium]|nr:hypothetical protein [Opitutales bacterium]
MNTSCFYFLKLFLHLFLLLGPCVMIGQQVNEASVDRDEYFRRLEERALKLSGKFAEISGTEPVKLFSPRQAKQYTSRATSPGLQGADSSFAEADTESSFSEFYSDQNNSEFSSLRFTDDEVIEYQPTIEDKRGQYFLRPFIALQAPSDQKYETPTPGLKKLDSGIGYSLGLQAGTRIENFSLGLRLSYHYNEFSRSVGITELTGENELFSLIGFGGYSISLREDLTFEFGGGLGFANRFNFATINIGGSSLHDVSEKTVFTYEFSLLLDYAYTENLSAFAGYRLVGMSENGPFQHNISHQFEIGMGASF